MSTSILVRSGDYTDDISQTCKNAIDDFEQNGRADKLREEFSNDNVPNLFNYNLYNDTEMDRICKFFENLAKHLPEAFDKKYITKAIMGFTTPKPSAIVLKGYLDVHGIEFMSEAVFDILTSINKYPLRFGYSANRYHLAPVEYFLNIGVDPNSRKNGNTILDQVILNLVELNKKVNVGNRYYKYNHFINEINDNIDCLVKNGGKLTVSIPDISYIDKKLLESARRFIKKPNY